MWCNNSPGPVEILPAETAFVLVDPCFAVKTINPDIPQATSFNQCTGEWTIEK